MLLLKFVYSTNKGNVGYVNGQHSTEDPTDEEAIEVDEVETLSDETEDAEQGKVEGNPKSDSVANTEPVKFVVANEVIDEIVYVEIETIEEVLVVILGEYTSLGQLRRHYDGTYWKEKEKKNTQINHDKSTLSHRLDH
jgi:hypothetical protein